MFNSQDQLQEQNEEGPLHCRRPFQPKFFRELNSHHGKVRRSRKKHKEASISKAKLEKLQKIGMKGSHSRNDKKLPQTIRGGNRILGIWKNGQLDGDVEIYYSNGVVFKGVYQNGIKIKGHFKFTNNFEYIGHCFGSKFNGEGSLIFPSGKIITGQWRDNNHIDKGKIEYPQGEVYYGDIRNLKKHGKGYLFFTNNTKYVGEFQHGLIQGYGTFFVNDQPDSIGRWKNGQLQDSLQTDNTQLVKEEHFNDVHEMCQMIKNSQDMINTKEKIAEERKNQKEYLQQRNIERKSSRKSSKKLSSQIIGGRKRQKKQFIENESANLMDQVLEEL